MLAGSCFVTTSEFGQSFMQRKTSSEGLGQRKAALHNFHDQRASSLNAGPREIRAYLSSHRVAVNSSLVQ